MSRIHNAYLYTVKIQEDNDRKGGSEGKKGKITAKNA